ncbi:hypothetical protein HDU83_005772 [Entophlyctis luteolus]|nr:hypothetical protein HDU83_005772 [Entophlyctis luteolus]
MSVVAIHAPSVQHHQRQSSCPNHHALDSPADSTPRPSTVACSCHPVLKPQLPMSTSTSTPLFSAQPSPSSARRRHRSRTFEWTNPPASPNTVKLPPDNANVASQTYSLRRGPLPPVSGDFKSWDDRDLSALVTTISEHVGAMREVLTAFGDVSFVAGSVMSSVPTSSLSSVSGWKNFERSPERAHEDVEPSGNDISMDVEFVPSDGEDGEWDHLADEDCEWEML